MTHIGNIYRNEYKSFSVVVDSVLNQHPAWTETALLEAVNTYDKAEALTVGVGGVESRPNKSSSPELPCVDLALYD